MKKHFKSLFALMIVFMLLSVLSGCSGYNIATLKSWSFQYNQGSNDFSLFFGLLNESDEAISGNVDVDIRIVNDKNEEVYKATKSVTSSDFGYYTSQAAGEQYLAEIRIPEKDITCGKSSNGTVYLTVYKDNVVKFDEVNCNALYCLPVSDVGLTAENLPVEINVKSYDGSIASTIRIEDVSYVYDKNYTSTLKITVTGTKTYGTSDSYYDMINYKLFDSQECVVETGQMFITSISEGESFKDDSINIYDITPGDTYKIVFSEYTW